MYKRRKLRTFAGVDWALHSDVASVCFWPQFFPVPKIPDSTEYSVLDIFRCLLTTQTTYYNLEIYAGCDCEGTPEGAGSRSENKRADPGTIGHNAIRAEKELPLRLKVIQVWTLSGPRSTIQTQINHKVSELQVLPLS